MISILNPAPNGQPQMYHPTVDMGASGGLVTIEVEALDYGTAYRAAVEQLLLDPTGTVLHRMQQVLLGD